MPIRSASAPRKRLLVHLSQAVETLGLRKEPGTHVEPLKGALNGKVKVQFFDVNRREFGHFENISDALVRLDQGIYGKCSFCGQRIEARVLRQKPWATECLACENQERQP